MSKTLKAHLFLIIVNVIYGANYTIAKALMHDYIHPMGFILLRVLGATTLFIIVNPFFKREKVERKDLLLLAACGLFGVAINQLLFFKGLDLTGAINASLMITTLPMLVLFVAAILIKEKVTLRKIFGILAGASGAIVLVLFNKHIDDNKHAVMGDIWIFLNAFSYGIYLVISKPLLKKYHPVTVIKWVFIFGLPMVIPFGYQQLSEVQWSTFDTNTWLGVAFVVVGSTFFAYLFNILALKEVSAEVVSIYIYVQPVIATIFSMYFNHEHLTLVHIAASLLIFGGVYLVSSKPEETTA
jgi:drug/metabolite transporter (DMT)-like permease